MISVKEALERLIRDLEQIEQITHLHSPKEEIKELLTLLTPEELNQILKGERCDQS